MMPSSTAETLSQRKLASRTWVGQPPSLAETDPGGSRSLINFSMVCSIHTSATSNMSKTSNKKKSEQLGMPFGTAAARLRKLVLFHVLVRHEENLCFQCGDRIQSADELSIEHKKPWLDNSVELFWDLSNIAFSHNVCNTKAKRPRKRKLVHGTRWAYQQGCRCFECAEYNRKTTNFYRRRSKGVRTPCRVGSEVDRRYYKPH